jgi:hypothetical protein
MVLHRRRRRGPALLRRLGLRLHGLGVLLVDRMLRDLPVLLRRLLLHRRVLLGDRLLRRLPLHRRVLLGDGVLPDRALLLRLPGRRVLLVDGVLRDLTVLLRRLLNGAVLLDGRVPGCRRVEAGLLNRLPGALMGELVRARHPRVVRRRVR